MSNPSGDALVAIGIRDTQKLSRGKICRALTDNSGSRVWPDACQTALGITVGAILIVFFML